MLTRRLREWSRVPIIVISARGREADKVAVLDAGADDYLTKPFGVGELLARMRVALRHVQQAAGAPAPIIEIGALRIDLARREVKLDGAEVHLTPIEYRLLALLAQNAGPRDDPPPDPEGGVGPGARRPRRTTCASTWLSCGGRSRPTRRGRACCRPSPASATGCAKRPRSQAARDRLTRRIFPRCGLFIALDGRVAALGTRRSSGNHPSPTCRPPWTSIRERLAQVDRRKLLERLAPAIALFLGILSQMYSKHTIAFAPKAVALLVVAWALAAGLGEWLPEPSPDETHARWRTFLRKAAATVTVGMFRNVLFFLVPVWFASSTLGSINMLAPILLAAVGLLRLLSQPVPPANAGAPAHPDDVLLVGPVRRAGAGGGGRDLGVAPPVGGAGRGRGVAGVQPGDVAHAAHDAHRPDRARGRARWWSR